MRQQKYAAGFRQRLGNYPKFEHNGQSVIWLHCVSVGETNAARPLVDKLIENFPDHRLIFSTTTKTGHELAEKIFAEKADAIIYFPFDWKFSVRRALANYTPSLVLLMETELWPRFIREAKYNGAKVAIVNGRLSEKSFGRYSKVLPFIKRVLANIDLALMQSENDMRRFIGLGMPEARTSITGNLKFDYEIGKEEDELTKYLRTRFEISEVKPLIVAASTHEPEEKWILESLDSELGQSCRLLIAPRHPERFQYVADILSGSSYSFARRSLETSESDRDADVILLDSIGELRAVYPLAEIVFVGGSLIPHGGQSILEPAAAGKPIVIGPYMINFDAVVKEFLDRDALIQTPEVAQVSQNSERLYEAIVLSLLNNKKRRKQIGENAASAVDANRGASGKTVRQVLALSEPT